MSLLPDFVMRHQSHDNYRKNTIICSNIPGPRTPIILRNGEKSLWMNFFMPDIDCPGVAAFSLGDTIKIGVYGDRLRLKLGAQKFAQCFDDVFAEVVQ